ncbi:MgtC/SapB family protein [Paracoccus sp. Z118]|uniref:MgtC/SapB family protein n=1 Tax=Paracoccus sp. Z118 TaxID=2851017 RepID=UPI001C2C5B16|nr:MgtC/SapB family protein [Paracoccus sp. Z118]MBV0891394.1 MgtC/SapB family protein [Paracoccus sp. Z118]
MDLGAFSPTHLSWMDAILRLGAAMLLSLALGLERFLRKKPIDFRPFVIIALASSALTVSIIEFAYGNAHDTITIDPARVLSGVMTGIGFIGAGALFREDHTVYGAGSAASIWAAGAVGLICGLGFLWLAGLLTLLLIALLLLSRPFTQEYTIQIDDEEDGDSSGSSDGRNWRKRR